MNLSKILKACLNYKVLLGVIAAIVAIYLFIPKLANLSWILLILVCPLSMVIMMASMQSKDKSNHKKNK